MNCLGVLHTFYIPCYLSSLFLCIFIFLKHISTFNVNTRNNVISHWTFIYRTHTYDSLLELFWLVATFSRNDIICTPFIYSIRTIIVRLFRLLFLSYTLFPFLSTLWIFIAGKRKKYEKMETITSNHNYHKSTREKFLAYEHIYTQNPAKCLTNISTFRLLSSKEQRSRCLFALFLFLFIFCLLLCSIQSLFVQKNNGFGSSNKSL